MFSYHLRLALKSLRRTPVVAALMIGAAIVELAIGIKAERQPLEHVARPLSQVEH